MSTDPQRTDPVLADLPALRLRGRPVWIARNGEAKPLERKHAALLAWLWLEGPTPRGKLAGLLWPEVPEDRARGNLRQRLSKLRQLAGELVIDEAGLLSLASDVRMLPASEPGLPLLQALEFDDCEAFARWLEGRREADREGRKLEWLRQVRSAAQGQRLDDALYAADQLLQTDRESEEAYRTLMQVYFLRGDHAAALSAWDRCRDMLRQLYGVRPSAATQALGHSILDAAKDEARSHEAGNPAVLPLPPVPVLRARRFVGRDAALQQLAQGWQAGHVLVVGGVAGVGKSRLLAEWQARLGGEASIAPIEPLPFSTPATELAPTLNPASATPLATASAATLIEASATTPAPFTAAATARPGDQVLPYASISRLLLAALQRCRPALDSPHALLAARLLPQLAIAAGVAVEPVKTDYERTQCLLALGRVLNDCAGLGCTAFVLDDLQFADAASLAALKILAEPAAAAVTDRAAVRFALALRVDEAGAEAQALLASLLATGRCTRVDLLPLTVEQVAELLAGLQVGAVDAPGWAPILWRQVGGNPAFVLECVKLLLSGAGPVDAAAGSLPVPPGIERVIQRRFELLSPRARHLAQLAALAGHGYSLALAAAALACAPLELGDPLRELEQCQFFDGRLFAHDVVAEVTARSVPAAVAEFMHRFIAEYLQSRDAPAAQVATHWAACGDWPRAGRAYQQAAAQARAAALANEHAELLDRAIAAFERAPQCQAELFEALDERLGADESAAHEALRPQLIARLEAMAQTEAQRLSALNHRCGLITNTGQPLDEAAVRSAIDRSQTLGLRRTAWEFSRVLGWQLSMTNRADEGLALMQANEPWILAEADAPTRAAYRLARANVFAFGDRLAEAIAEGRLALAASMEAGDWPNALPAMSNLGVMHYWRSEHDAAHQVLSQARERREALYGRGGAGLKIDIHLGAVLYELGRDDEAERMLQQVLLAMADWPDNDYTRLDRLLTRNHLAQMYLARGRRDEAAAALEPGADGMADRYRGRHLTLRLRWQRLFGQVSPVLLADLQALAQRLTSPFNNALNLLELARLLPAPQALAHYLELSGSPVALQRPGLQLHCAVLGALAARACDDRRSEQSLGALARSLRARTTAFDLPADELQARMNELG